MTNLDVDPIRSIHERRSAAIGWARRALRPGSTVVLDTETAFLHGPICEVAVISTEGAILLDTLVNPRVPIDPSTQAIHHLTDEMVQGAPTFRTVLIDLLHVTAGKTITAYNSNYDFGVVLRDADRYGMDPEHLEDSASWRCLSQARADWLGHPDHYLPLQGSHRALGDCFAALQVLRTISNDHVSNTR